MSSVLWAPGGRICPQPPGDERIPGRGHPGAPRTLHGGAYALSGAGDRRRHPQPVRGNGPQEHPVPLAAAGILYSGPAANVLAAAHPVVFEPSSSQRGEEHYPKTLVMENMARQRQELLNDSRPEA